MRLSLSMLCLGFVWLGAVAAPAMVVEEPIDITGKLIKATLQPDGGGSLSAFGIVGATNGIAGDDGLIVEGFGVPNPYVPSRRFNERLEVLEEYADRPVIRYSYDCEGPNIDGLHVTRLMELFPDEASVRVTWTIANNGKERQWVAPWIRSSVMPGGTAGPEDRADVPTQEGIINAKDVLFHPASRNWVAVTDVTVKESFCAIFHAAHMHSFLIARDDEYPAVGVQASYVPRYMKPGDTWETKYRVMAVRGLAHVDFACEELAVQADYSEGKLVLLMAPSKVFPGMTIHPKIVATNGRVWELQAKKFDLLPGKLVRATFDWQPEGEDTYNLVAKIKQDGKDFLLGAETGSPNGAIDTQVTVGKPGVRRMVPWTEAPRALELHGRKLERSLLSADGLTAWAESPMFKVYREDEVVAQGSNSNHIRLSLARNEYEAKQIVLRPKEGHSLFDVRLEPGEFRNDAGDTLPADSVTWREVGYVRVRVPSHYEGPTGMFPDPLLPRDKTEAAGGQCTPLWVSVHVPTDAKPGVYRGPLRLVANNLDPIEWTLEITVFDFALPAMPALRTDFGFDIEGATQMAKARGGAGGAALLNAYQSNALEHRVTLRELNALPGSPAALASFGATAKASLARGTTTFSAPLEWLDMQPMLKQAEQAVRNSSVGDRAFVQFADTPPPGAWAKVLEEIKRWKATAPSIRPMLTTAGISPFIPDDLDLWCVQSPVFDTAANKHILEQIAKGREVWWYVDHVPPRPYGNLFLDFTGVEHRILFWQAWALGIKGFHYWGVNYVQPGQDPYDDVSDATPVNGDGLLVYPGASGPVDSQRWEIVRDGIEDYDYFAIFMERRAALNKQGGNEALLARAAKVYNIGGLVPDLVTFPREPEGIEARREELGRMIEEMDHALGR